ncbi:MAG: 3-hydroxybutyrate dehydrogenase [Erysipelothrix sp.]|nr:3-hydroxybutyrate dehydrogenase [Erysipelothrix sp.]
MQEHICIVTGAASGIGLAISELFVAQKFRVLMVDRQENELMKEAKRLECEYVVADLSQRSECKKIIDFAKAKFDYVDILVNVAGLQHVSAIETFDEDKWDYMLNVMLTAPFLLSKYVWPLMKEKGWGRIIHLNSIHGLVASEFKSAYISAKHGLSGLTKVSALEGAPYGITVNSICPAYVKTPLVDKQIADQAKLHHIDEDEVITKIMLQKAAIKQLIKVEDIAHMVLYLCGEHADMITGSTMTIDGGWTVA